jgi:pimeloyl-ACP methyl ester carboxylesterase
MTVTPIPNPVDLYEDINNLTLHYLKWGTKDLNPLLLLHGITSNAHAWDNLAPRWAQDNWVMALDQRGHGESDWTKEGYSVTGFASDIYGFSKKLGLAPFDVVGHSLGSRNLISFAGTHSKLISHLVLSDCGPELPREGAQTNSRRVASRPTSFRSFDDARAYYMEVNPTWTKEQLEHTVKHSLRTNYAGKIVWRHDPELSWIAGSFGLKEVPHLWEQCAAITCKTLILHGEKSHVLNTEIITRMLQVLPNAEVHHFKDATHSLPQDHPDEYYQIVQDFLKS